MPWRESSRGRNWSFCEVVCIITLLTVVVLVEGVGAVAGAGVAAGGVAFFRRKAFSAELERAEPKTPILLDSPAAVWVAVSVATCPATLPGVGGGAAGAEAPAGCVGTPVAVPPTLVTSSTRMPLILFISSPIFRRASAAPG